MASLNMTADDAFAKLAMISSHTNRKVRDIAAEIVAVAIDAGAPTHVPPDSKPPSMRLAHPEFS